MGRIMESLPLSTIGEFLIKVTIITQQSKTSCDQFSRMAPWFDIRLEMDLIAEAQFYWWQAADTIPTNANQSPAR